VTELQFAQSKITAGKAMQRLLNNKDFRLVFDEVYHKQFMNTVGKNLHKYNDDTRKRSNELVAARGIFIDFIDQVLSEAAQAEEFIAEASAVRYEEPSEEDGQ